jgi:hypothetical protein
MKILHLKPRGDAYTHSAGRYAIFILIALLSTSSLAHGASLEGYWYGKGYQPLVRKTMQWLTINRPDGSFSVEFREYSKCRLVSVQRETGRWSVLGNVITKKVLTSNGQPVSATPYYTDTYKIIEIDHVKMRIVHEKSRQDWTLERVAEDFTFPDCNHVS